MLTFPLTLHLVMTFSFGLLSAFQVLLFPVRRYASEGISSGSVYMYVSHAGVISKRLNGASSLFAQMTHNMS